MDHINNKYKSRPFSFLPSYYYEMAIIELPVRACVRVGVFAIAINESANAVGSAE